MTELVRQCRAACSWVWRNGDSFGGHRDRIYVSSHSAGGHLTAMMMATDWTEYASDLPAQRLRGGCGISSGLYDLAAIHDPRFAPSKSEHQAPVMHNSSALGAKAVQTMVCSHPTSSVARVAFGVSSMMA
jgi:hypothetical protein